MKRRVFVILLCSVLLNALPASAQSTAVDRWTPPLGNQTARKVAGGVSWGTVGLALALDAREAWRAPDRRHAVSLFAMRGMTTWVAASIAKGLTHRTRPDGSDDQSFYSMHTAFAFQGLGGPKLAIELPLAFGTGAGRVAAGRHYLTDVLVGAGVGALTSRIR